MFKLVLEKAEVKLPTPAGSLKKQENSRKTSTFAWLNMSNFDCVDHSKLWTILKEIGIPEHLTCLLRNLYAGQEATVRTGHGTTGHGSKLGMEYVKTVYCHPAYLSYMQRTSWETLGWKKPKLKSRLPGESHGWRSLVATVHGVAKTSDTTERLHFYFHSHPFCSPLTSGTISLFCLWFHLFQILHVIAII